MTPAQVSIQVMFDAVPDRRQGSTKSPLKGCGCQYFRGVAGCGVLSLYDNTTRVMFGKVSLGGTCVSYILVIYTAFSFSPQVPFSGLGESSCYPPSFLFDVLRHCLLRFLYINCRLRISRAWHKIYLREGNSYLNQGTSCAVTAL